MVKIDSGEDWTGDGRTAVSGGIPMLIKRVMLTEGSAD